jgi:nitrile hydratase beta subunit
VNGPHDLGGAHGFGPVEVEPDEPVFHADWERRIFGITMAVIGRRIANLDEVRYARERIPPARYLASSYYENWLRAMETLLVEKGVAAPEELAERREAVAEGTRDDDFVAGMLAFVREGASMLRQVPHAWRFRPGDAVLARNVHPRGHTRLPRYVRGRHGTVTRVHGAFPLPDASAHGDDRAEHLYNVRFEGEELWGESAERRTSVSIDLYESYLAPAR